DRREHAVALERQLLAVLGLGGDGDGVALDLRPGHLRFQLELHALLLEELVHFVDDLAVTDGKNAGQEFENGDLGTQSLPYRPEFEADITTADDNEMLGNRVEVQRFRGANDVL